MFGLTIVAIVSAILLNCSIPMNLSEMKIYPTTMVVIDVNENTDTVLLATFEGFTYEIEGCEDWYVGDVCSTIMWNSGTENTIEDDVILYSLYDGWVDNWGWESDTQEPLFTF